MKNAFLFQGAENGADGDRVGAGRAGQQLAGHPVGFPVFVDKHKTVDSDGTFGTDMHETAPFNLFYYNIIQKTSDEK